MCPVSVADEHDLACGEGSDEVWGDAVGLLAASSGGDAEACRSGLVEVFPDAGGSCKLEEVWGEWHEVDDVGADVGHEPFGVLAKAGDALCPEDECDAG
jgi:hypothetical protein